MSPPPRPLAVAEHGQASCSPRGLRAMARSASPSPTLGRAALQAAGRLGQRAASGQIQKWLARVGLCRPRGTQVFTDACRPFPFCSWAARGAFRSLADRSRFYTRISQLQLPEIPSWQRFLGVEVPTCWLGHSGN